jgi:hypothetical protein
MTARFRRNFGYPATLILLALIAFTGCRSYHVGITVENRTGAAIQLLEIDYPSASFGAGSLAPGANLHYQIQVRGAAPVKVQYTAADGVQKQISGPTLSEGDEGQLQIVLLPDGKVEFTPQISHRR